MEKIARLVALGVNTLANDTKEPRWDEQNPKTARFVEAWKQRHGK
jgi:hypothetical protein